MSIVVFLIYPDFQILDLSGPLGVFENAARFQPGAYELCVVADGGGLTRASCGVSVTAQDFDTIDAADTLLVVGGRGTRAAARNPRIRGFLQQSAPHLRRLGSVCSGTYVLAEAGVLDGLRATTHWERSQHFAAAYPNICLEPDRIYVQDGRLWTSAGVTAGIDMALAMVAQDYGEALARRVAQELVVYYRRPGGQSQFMALPEAGDGAFGELMVWMRAHLCDRLDVERLALQAGMSPRHFSRRFTAEVGLSPAQAVERLRLEAARARLEGGAAPAARIARETGFGDAERMRRAFVRGYGLSPQALRRRPQDENVR
jgi:transcriptional regulator GlxA family with amidase domain